MAVFHTSKETQFPISLFDDDESCSMLVQFCILWDNIIVYSN